MIGPPLEADKAHRANKWKKYLGISEAGCWLGNVERPWIEQPIHFVDFEGAASSGILEFGVATLQRGKITAAHTRLCRATGHVRTADVAVHRIAPDTVAHQAPFADEFDAFCALRASGPLAAHFAGFENSLIKAVWPYPRHSPDFARPGRTLLDWGPWVDTGRLCPQFLPGNESARLGDLIATCQLQDELDTEATRWCPAERRFYHAALYDALAAALLLRRLAQDSFVAHCSLPKLLALSTLDPARRDALQQGDLFGES